MVNDIVVVIGFVVVLIAICRMWNLYTMKQYKKSKANSLNLTYGFYADNTKGLGIAGAGSDGNGDYDVAQAVKKIELPDDVRIKVNE